MSILSETTPLIERDVFIPVQTTYLTYSQLRHFAVKKLDEVDTKATKIFDYTACGLFILGSLSCGGVFCSVYYSTASTISCLAKSMLISSGSALGGGAVSCCSGICYECTKRNLEYKLLQRRITALCEHVGGDDNTRVIEDHVKDLFPVFSRFLSDEMDIRQAAACYRDPMLQNLFMEYVHFRRPKNTFIWLIAEELHKLPSSRFIELYRNNMFHLSEIWNADLAYVILDCLPENLANDPEIQNLNHDVI